jgi:hypothetical protein
VDGFIYTFARVDTMVRTEQGHRWYAQLGTKY